MNRGIPWKKGFNTIESKGNSSAILFINGGRLGGNEIDSWLLVIVGKIRGVDRNFEGCRGRVGVSTQRGGDFDHFEWSWSMWLWEMRTKSCHQKSTYKIYHKKGRGWNLPNPPPPALVAPLKYHLVKACWCCKLGAFSLAISWNKGI